MKEDLQKILGFLNWFKSFVSNFSSGMKYLYDKLKRIRTLYRQIRYRKYSCLDKRNPTRQITLP